MRSRPDERGTAVLEMALTLPLVLLLVLGALDFGRAVYLQTILGNAARDGARFAIVDPNNTTCIKTVAANLGSIANLSASDVTITKGTVDVDQPITVTVRSTYQPVSQLIVDALGLGTISLQASATMRIRNVPAAQLSC